MNQTTKNSALAALEGMREIVRHEMLIQGLYVDDEITNDRLARSGAICGGRKHCAIGSLWVGAGVKYSSDDGLPGITWSVRPAFLRTRHGLRVAYNALNEAALQFARRNDEIEIATDNALEDLFEGYYGDELTKRDMLNIIAAAKRKIIASAKS